MHNCNQFQVPSICSDVIPPRCSSNAPSSWVRGGGVLVTGRPAKASWNTEASWKTTSNWMRGDGILVLVRGRVAATFGSIASSRKRALWNTASWRSATWRVAALVRGGGGRATHCGWRHPVLIWSVSALDVRGSGDGEARVAGVGLRCDGQCPRSR